MTFFVYLVQCADRSYYCGYTKDLSRRIKQHNNSAKGSKYIKGKRPVVLKYHEEYVSLREALKREYQIKQLTHIEKAKLIKMFAL